MPSETPDVRLTAGVVLTPWLSSERLSFKVVGHPVAVANATPAVRAAADLGSARPVGGGVAASIRRSL